MNTKDMGLVWFNDQWRFFIDYEDTGKDKKVRVDALIGYDNINFALYKIRIKNRWSKITSDCIKRLPEGNEIRGCEGINEEV